MKIVVCVKQVPDIADVKVDPETGTLVREGMASALNPFCEYALDHAARLKNSRDNIEITVVSMGPPQARVALLRCLELESDRAVLVSDFKFAGSDTWATAWTLAEVIRKIVPDFDLILVGKQAVDGDTAQVGPELAEILGVAQVMYAVEIRLVQKGKRIHVKRETDNGYEVIEARLPALVSVSKGEAVRRIPSLGQVLDARRKPYTQVGAGELDLADSELGLTGSYTQVVNVFPPKEQRSGVKLEGLGAVEAAEKIVSFLRQNTFIEGSG